MELPTITEEDLRTFHLKHFPTTPLPQSFTSAQEIDQEQEEELGYYPDGTKRTLTDDQIAMFRHSEIQQLIKMLRSQRTTSSQDSRSVDDVGTASTVDATQTSSKQNRDTKDSKKWLGTATGTNHGTSSQPRSTKKRRRPNQATRSPINGVRHDPEDYLEEGDERTYRRKCREEDEQKAEIVVLDY